MVREYYIYIYTGYILNIETVMPLMPLLKEI